MARSASSSRTNVVKLPERKKPPGMWRSLLASVRLLPRRSKGAPVHRVNPFTPAQPLPGVVGEGKPKIPQIAMDAAAVFDSALGGDVPASNWAGQYANNYFASAYAEGQEWLGYAVLAILSQRTEYRTITETFATEMTREWVEFRTDSDDKDKQKRIKQLEERLDDLRVKDVFRQAIANDGYQGRGQIYIDTGDEDDPDELKTPIGSGGKDTIAKFGKDGEYGQDKAYDFDPNSSIIEGGRNTREDRADGAGASRRHIRRLAAIEPMWCYPSQYNANDPLKPDWYKPEFWWVMGKEVHRSRLLTFVSSPVPDMLKPAYSFGGLSRTQMAKPYVDFWLRNRTSASDLLNNFSIVSLATDLQVTTMDEGSELFQRIATQNYLRDNQGMFLVNKDTEELSVLQTSLGGVKELVAQSAEHMTIPSRIPIVKLFGDQPSGLNASSEGVIRMWYDTVHAEQESLLREPLQTIVNFAMIELWGEVDDDIEFEFVALWQLDEAGKAAIQATKANQRAIDIEAGIVLPDEGRKAAARDPDSQYAGLDLDEPLPEPPDEDLFGPGEGEPGAPGEGPPGGQPGGQKPGRRNLTGLTNQAARFGGATSGGFPNR